MKKYKFNRYKKILWCDSMKELYAYNNGKIQDLECITSFGFYLDNKYWPTCYHYIQAQKFHGTAFEERIRKARMITEIQFLCKPRKKLIYDNKNPFSEKLTNTPALNPFSAVELK